MFWWLRAVQQSHRNYQNDNYGQFNEWLQLLEIRQPKYRIGKV